MKVDLITVINELIKEPIQEIINQSIQEFHPAPPGAGRMERRRGQAQSLCSLKTGRANGGQGQSPASQRKKGKGESIL
jgi:hypothetical protein